MIRVIFENLAVLKDLSHSLVCYVLRHHLLMAVDGHADIVSASLLSKPDKDIRRIPIGLIHHTLMLLPVNGIVKSPP